MLSEAAPWPPVWLSRTTIASPRKRRAERYFSMDATGSATNWPIRCFTLPRPKGALPSLAAGPVATFGALFGSELTACRRLSGPPSGILAVLARHDHLRVRRLIDDVRARRI